MRLHFAGLLGIAILAVSPLEAEWRVVRHQDPMTDELSVSMVTEGSWGVEREMVVFLFTQQGTLIQPAGHDYPGESVSARIDDNPVIRLAGANHLGSANVVGQARKGEAMTLSYHEWPEGATKYTKISLEGFGDAFLKVLTQVPHVVFHDTNGKEYRVSGVGESWVGQPVN